MTKISWALSTHRWICVPYSFPSAVYFSVALTQIEPGVMNNIEELLLAITIALVVATFLLNTGHALKAIELCKESLVLLNNNAQRIKKQLSKLIYIRIYRTMLEAHNPIHDNTNAITYGRKLLVLYCECGMTVQEGWLSMRLSQIYICREKYLEAKEFCERAITIMKEIGDRNGEAMAYGNLGIVFQSLSDYVKAKEYHEKSLAITIELGDRNVEVANYGNLGIVFQSLGDYVKAKEYHEKALAINIEIGDRAGEATNYGNLGTVFQSLGDYVKAKEYHEKALAINIEIGDSEGEATNYGNLGTVFQSLSNYVKAKEYHEKSLEKNIEIGDKAGEATNYGNLGNVFQSLSNYVKAKEYHEKSLGKNIEIGDRAEEATNYGNLGSVFRSLGDYVKAKEYHEKALAIKIKIGDRKGEATNYGNLGIVFQSLGNYVKAKEYHEKSLKINTEIGDRAGEATNYGNLGTVFQSLGDYVKAKEYHEKALAIKIKIGDRAGEAINYGNLGSVLQSLGDYVKAKEYHEKALAITMEIGDRKGESTYYGHLGTMFESLGDYVKAKGYLEKALVIKREIRDKPGEAEIYAKLGNVYNHLRKYRECVQNLEKALAIDINIGRRRNEGSNYRRLGNVHRSLGDNMKAKIFYEKALAIATEIGNRPEEAASCARLGRVLNLLDEYFTAEKYLEKALSIVKDVTCEDNEAESICYFELARTKLSQKKFQEACFYLFQSIKNCEDLQSLNADNDQIKISLADKHTFPYQLLSALLSGEGKPNSALYVEELGRARALADLMATQYSADKHVSANPKSWVGIENVIMKEKHCTFLYISYVDQEVFLWILKTSGVISFREVTVDQMTLHKKLAIPAENVDEFFAIMAKSFRSFGILPEEVCEDRSLNDSEPAQFYYSNKESLAVLRQAKEDEDPEPSLTLFHEMLIKPVFDLLDEPEIIIVPHRNLYRVPFAALLDKSRRYLSETFKIRIIPSLTTLKLIQDSPADYHSHTGALIVGDPDVGDVIYNGHLNKNFVSLPGARKEAKMIGGLLGDQPLLGKEATKQAVLQRISSVSLIHFAAHGNAERGEIALAPPCSTTKIPQEEDYLLKMSDISKVQLRAKLVVLSCCHSARGQIRAEGAVGIARAFLGSGARSVLVALWALEDSATKQFMSCFYYHLVRGESASESLHEAMKWMRDKQWLRGNSVTKVSDWAPFMLIGDNVTFDFGL